MCDLEDLTTWQERCFVFVILAIVFLLQSTSECCAGQLESGK